MDGISINKYALFMFRLRGMGLYTNQIMSRHLPGRGYGDHEQFLIACLLTGKEIQRCNRRCNTAVLKKYKVFLRSVERFSSMKDSYAMVALLVC
ncbi:hypothetical protein DPMN_017234 [Dreissena polymorpha]|uniref:Uncharacterized protein n=1 Tax=Dreissena polymorpha TaxID=45954 RepID=A0A9D4NEB6_DREPO|nr:hypothetical protein DPMN_017234 [Dreissena polymorpha]